MLTQDIIEQFFLDMIAELREDNVPILNDYSENFRNYPYSADVVEKDDLQEDDYYEYLSDDTSS